MKRKLALLLAGCLAITPAAAGYYPVQAFAAETGAETESGVQLPISVSVSDENGNTLTAISEDAAQTADAGQYSVTVGDTRQLTAVMEQGEGFPALSVWSSETPEIIDIDDDGIITAKSEGTGLITLSISSDASQVPTEFKYEIIVSKAEGEFSETAAEESADADTSAAEEILPEETAAQAGVPAETVVTADEEAAATAVTTTEAADTAATAATAAEAADPNADPAAAAATTEAANPDADPAAATATTEAADPDADPAAATEDPAQTATASIAMNSAVQTGNASSLVDPAQGDAPVVTPHWEGSTSNWSYITGDGTKATGKVEIDGQTYIFTPEGLMRTGWAKYGDYWYYLEKSGQMIKGWLKVNGSWYYLNDDGAMKTGRLDLGGTSYFFDESGKMQTGWTIFDDKWYYLGPGGSMLKGWQYVDKKWYYLTSDGSMKTGRLDISGTSYFFDESGVMKTGWAKYDGDWYYLGPGGSILKGWQYVGKKWYYLTDDGTMKIGWLETDGDWYYLGASGAMMTGWLKSGGYWYYLDNSGAMKTGWVKTDGCWYYFDASGAMKTGWKQLNGRWYYFNPDGDMRYGWLKDNGNWYYLGAAGYMKTGSQYIGGTWYYFSANGALAISTNSYSNTQEFIECIAPLIIKYAPRYNVKVISPIIAQAILESASGESSLGKKYNNFFGLKCGTLWTGKSVNLSTGEEYTPGHYTTISANFRVFDTMEEGVKGYFEFLFNNRTRYNNLIGETDPYEYLVKIKEDGYATSSKYVQNVYNVILRYDLTRFDP